MYAISLQNDRIDELNLHGTGIAAPFKGCHYDPQSGPGETVAETLELALENNSPATISDGYTKIQAFLTAAAKYWNKHIGRASYLAAVAVNGEVTWRSKILGGWVEQIGGCRATGSVGLRVHLTRFNYWEGPVTALPLSNYNSIRTLLPVMVYNHDDAGIGHDNTISIAAQDLSGDLPAPVKLLMRSAAGPSVTRIYIGLDQDHTFDWFTTMREAENASGGTVQADGACSSGNKKSCAWSGTGDAELLTWAISTLDVACGGGRFFKALLRIPGGGTAYNDLWLRLRVKIGSSVVWDGPWVLTPAGVELVEVNTLQVPPYLSELDYLDTVNVTLVAKRGTAGSHTLLIDFAELMPLDGWRKLQARELGLPPNQDLIDDSILGVVYYDISYAKTDWVAFGGPLLLEPGKDAKLYFSLMEGNNMPIDRYLHVQAWRAARRVNL